MRAPSDLRDFSSVLCRHRETVEIAETLISWPGDCFLPFWVSAPSNDPPRTPMTAAITIKWVTRTITSSIIFWFMLGKQDVEYEQWNLGETDKKLTGKTKNRKNQPKTNQNQKPKTKTSQRIETTDNICTRENMTVGIQSENKCWWESKVISVQEFFSVS